MEIRGVFSQEVRDAFTSIFSAMVTVHGGFAVGTDTTTFALSAATSYMLDGVNYTKAAADDIASPNGNTSASEYRKDLISLDSSGAVTVTAGTAATTQLAAEVPDCPANECPIGYIEVPASFTAGTDDVTTGMLVKWDHRPSFVNTVAS